MIGFSKAVEILMNTSEDYLSLTLAKLPFQPFYGVAITLAGITGFTGRDHIWYHSAGTLRAVQWDEMIGAYGIPETRLRPAIRTAIMKIFQTIKPIFLCEGIGEVSFSGSSPLLCESSLYWMRCVIALGVLLSLFFVFVVALPFFLAINIQFLISPFPMFSGFLCFVFSSHFRPFLPSLFRNSSADQFIFFTGTILAVRIMFIFTPIIRMKLREWLLNMTTRATLSRGIHSDLTFANLHNGWQPNDVSVVFRPVGLDCLKYYITIGGYNL